MPIFSSARHSSTLLARLSPLLLATVVSLGACSSEPNADETVDGSGGAAAGGAGLGAGGVGAGGASAIGGNNAGGTVQTVGGSDAGGGVASGGQLSTGGVDAGGGSDGAGGGGGDVAAGGDAGSGGGTAVSACPAGLSGSVPTLPGSMGQPVATATSASLPNGSNSQLEGPVWAAGSLYVSHMRDYAGDDGTPGEVLRLNGSTLEVVVPGLGTNGLAVGSDGLILAASQQYQAVISLNPADLSASPVVVVGEYEGTPFNSPNDLTVRSDGTIYFSDPDWNCGTCPQTANRVYRVDPTGGISVINNAHQKPNGIRLSPDETTLYLAGDAQLQSFAVMPDGSVGAPSDFGNLVGGDGVAIDCAGNLYVAQPGQSRVVVFSPEGNEVGVLSGNAVTNLAFGGADGTTLYLTSSFVSNPGLYAVELDIPGLPY